MNMVLRGSAVLDGYGYIELTAVGVSTEIGKTAISCRETAITVISTRWRMTKSPISAFLPARSGRYAPYTKKVLI